MVQVDGPRRRVCIKFVNNERMQEVIRTTRGQLEFRHENGELSLVQVDIAGTAVAQWLRCCATNRKVAGSIPGGVIGIFH